MEQTPKPILMINIPKSPVLAPRPPPVCPAAPLRRMKRFREESPVRPLFLEPEPTALLVRVLKHPQFENGKHGHRNL